MEITTSSNQWQLILSQCLESLDSKYPRFSDAQIADKIDVSRATYNRIKNEKKVPRLENILKIVLGSENPHLLGDALDLHGNNLGQALGKLNLNPDKESTSIDKKLENILDDRDVFVAFIMCNNDYGITAEQLKDVLGNQAKEAIKTLIEANLIIKTSSSKYISNKVISISRSFNSIKKHLTTYSSHYKTEHVGKNRNYVHSLSEGLNKEGLLKAQAAHRRFHEEMLEIYKDDQNKGTIPSFSVAFCDTFTSQNLDESNKGILQ